MNAEINFTLFSDKANEIRQKLIVLAEKDLKENKKRQQQVKINSKLPTFSAPAYVIHLEESFSSSKNYNKLEKISKKVGITMRKEGEKFTIKGFESKDKKDNEEKIKEDSFYGDYQKINTKLAIAFKKNKKFKEGIKSPKEGFSSSKKDKKQTSDIIKENLENINVTKGFLSDLTVYERVKRSFYYLRDICEKIKKNNRKSTATHVVSPLTPLEQPNNRKNSKTSKSSDHFNQFEQIIMLKENIDDDEAVKMIRRRKSNLNMDTFKRYKSSNTLSALISPQKARMGDKQSDIDSITSLKFGKFIDASPLKVCRKEEESNLMDTNWSSQSITTNNLGNNHTVFDLRKSFGESSNIVGFGNASKGTVFFALKNKVENFERKTRMSNNGEGNKEKEKPYSKTVKFEEFSSIINLKRVSDHSSVEIAKVEVSDEGAKQLSNNLKPKSINKPNKYLTHKHLTFSPGMLARFSISDIIHHEAEEDDDKSSPKLIKLKQCKEEDTSIKFDNPEHSNDSDINFSHAGSSFDSKSDRNR